MARRVLAWECIYCGDLKKTEKICIRHEKTCLHNPEAKNCILCAHSYREYRDSTLSCRIRGCSCSRAVSADCKEYQKKNNILPGPETFMKGAGSL